MGQRGSLGLARRARGVEQDRNVGGIHLDVEVTGGRALPGSDDRRVRQRQRGSRITPHVLTFRRSRRVVQRNGNTAGPTDGEAPEDQLRAVRELDQDAIALGDARAHELGGMVDGPGDLVRRPTKTVGGCDQGLRFVCGSDPVCECSEG